MYHYLTINDGDIPIAKISSDDDIEYPDSKIATKLRNCLYVSSSDEYDPKAPKEYIITKKETLKPLLTRADKEGHAQRVFAAGGTLSGKSYLISKLAKDYIKQFPKNKVILFSWVNDDENYKEMRNNSHFHKIRIDESILDNPIELSELHDSVVIFDDIEHFADRDIVHELERLRNSCVNAGRHDNIDVLCARQNLLEGLKTKTLLNSCFQVIGFPHSSSRYQLGEWLRRHMFLDKRLINKILNVPSRWVIINRAKPSYCLHQKGCFLLT